MPFYSSLARDIRLNHLSTRIVIVTMDDAATARNYLSSHGVEVDEIVAKTPSPQKITGTPTIVLTSKRGIVQKLWRGQLETSAEREVRNAVGLESM